MVETRRPPLLHTLTEEQRAGIESNYVELPANFKVIPPFCVDGRTGPRQTSMGRELTGPYPQALGGSLNIAAVRWLLDDWRPFRAAVDDTLWVIRNKGFALGAHTGQLSDGEESSDCGFADNLQTDVSYLIHRTEEIWEILTDADAHLSMEKQVWDEAIQQASVKDASTIPTGYQIVRSTAGYEANFQRCLGEHQEVVAFVNMKPRTTLDVDNNQGETQAFNLDLWYVQEQAKALGLDVEKASLLTLGLYVATEMRLVEDRRGYRLPIIIRQ